MKKKITVVLVFLAIAALVVTCRKSDEGDTEKKGRALAPYEVKDFSHLLGMEGFSEALLKMHFALYKGYVTQTNKLLDQIREYAKSGKTDAPEYAELKRRLAFEFNGMKLHELYFGNLGGAGVLPDDNPLYDLIKENFGSFENWKKDFVATGKMRGIGWVVLVQDPTTGRLVNTWINEHETGHFVGGVPLVVMDVFEHAYLTDYGLDRAAYISAFLKNLDWKVVLERFGVEVPEDAFPKPAPAEEKKELEEESGSKTESHPAEAKASEEKTADHHTKEQKGSSEEKAHHG